MTSTTKCEDLILPSGFNVTLIEIHTNRQGWKKQVPGGFGHVDHNAERKN